MEDAPVDCERRVPPRTCPAPRTTSGKGALSQPGLQEGVGEGQAGSPAGRGAGRGFAHRSAAGTPGGCPGPGHGGQRGRHRACARTAAGSDSGPREAASAGGSRKSRTRCRSPCRVGGRAVEWSGRGWAHGVRVGPLERAEAGEGELGYVCTSPAFPGRHVRWSFSHCPSCLLTRLATVVRCPGVSLLGREQRWGWV